MAGRFRGVTAGFLQSLDTNGTLRVNMPASRDTRAWKTQQQPGLAKLAAQVIVPTKDAAGQTHPHVGTSYKTVVRTPRGLPGAVDDTLVPILEWESFHPRLFLGQDGSTIQLSVCPASPPRM